MIEYKQKLHSYGIFTNHKITEGRRNPLFFYAKKI